MLRLVCPARAAGLVVRGGGCVRHQSAVKHWPCWCWALVGGARPTARPTTTRPGVSREVSRVGTPWVPQNSGTPPPVRDLATARGIPRGGVSACGGGVFLYHTYRTFALKRPLRLTWPVLYRQFGADPAKSGNRRTVITSARTVCASSWWVPSRLRSLAEVLRSARPLSERARDGVGRDCRFRRASGGRVRIVAGRLRLVGPHPQVSPGSDPSPERRAS